jgi:hypothetical protein
MVPVMAVVAAVMIGVGWLVAHNESKELEKYEHHR